MSSKTTQPEAKATTEAANPLAKADAALAKAQAVKPKGSATAADVVEKLEAGVPPVVSEPDERTNRVVEVVLDKTTPSKAAAAKEALATVEAMLKEAQAVLPESKVSVTVTLDSRQANVTADALALYSEFAPNLGTDHANKVHDAAVFTAFWIVRKAMLAANAHRRSHVQTARQQHAVELGLTDEFPNAPEPAPDSDPDVGVDASTYGKEQPAKAKPKAQAKKSAPKAKPQPATAG